MRDSKDHCWCMPESEDSNGLNCERICMMVLLLCAEQLEIEPLLISAWITVWTTQMFFSIMRLKCDEQRERAPPLMHARIRRHLRSEVHKMVPWMCVWNLKKRQKVLLLIHSDFTTFHSAFHRRVSALCWGQWENYLCWCMHDLNS